MQGSGLVMSFRGGILPQTHIDRMLFQLCLPDNKVLQSRKALGVSASNSRRQSYHAATDPAAKGEGHIVLQPVEVGNHLL